jgi:hypothetical protein
LSSASPQESFRAHACGVNITVPRAWRSQHPHHFTTRCAKQSVERHLPSTPDAKQGLEAACTPSVLLRNRPLHQQQDGSGRWLSVAGHCEDRSIYECAIDVAVSCCIHLDICQIDGRRCGDGPRRGSMWTSCGLNGLSLPCRRRRHHSPSRLQLLHDGCNQHKEIARAVHGPRLPSFSEDRVVAPTITECNDGTMQM